MAKKSIKLDPAKVKHSKASDYDPKIWWLEELEGEILEFAKYVKNRYGIKSVSYTHLTLPTSG